MMLRRGGRPGLIGLAARTAVVTGTTAAPPARDPARHPNRAQAQYDQELYEAARQQVQIDAAAQAAVAQAAPPPPPSEPSARDLQAAPSAAAGRDLLAQLQQLAELKQAGLITDAEFAAAKAKLLG
jgi:hypothetical protein